MLFENISVLRADGTCLDGMSVAVENGIFTYIGEEKQENISAEVIDGSGKLMVPGFVNAHTHVSMTLMRGYGDDMLLDKWLYEKIFPFEDKLTAEDVYWGSLLGIAEMIASGTTSFSDMYYFCDKIAQAVLESGVKANIGRGISCFDPSKKFADLPAYQETIELIDTYHKADNGRILIDTAPHSEYTTRPDILTDIAEFASGHGIRVQVHISETRKEHLECAGRHGKTPALVMKDSGLFDLPVTAAHCVWLTDSDMELLLEKHITVAHCPQSNLKLASGIAQVEKMKKMGINVALGTDSAASNNNLDLMEEMRTAALLAKGISLDPCALPAGDALSMATRAGALAQGRNDCGDIQLGFCADFVVINTDRPSMTPCHSALSNLLYACGRDDLEMTVVNGRVLYKNGSFTTIDIERVLYEAKRCVQSLLKR